MSSNIIIADPQILITESLKIIINNSLRHQVIGVASNIGQLEEMLSNQNTELLITDHIAYKIDGAESLSTIKTTYPFLKILILTNVIHRNEIRELSRIGIKNIILKSTDEEELVQAIEATIKSKKYYSSEVLDIIVGSTLSNGIIESSPLTLSEVEIIKDIAKGLTTKEIGEKNTLVSTLE